MEEAGGEFPLGALLLLGWQALSLDRNLRVSARGRFWDRPHSNRFRVARDIVRERCGNLHAPALHCLAEERTRRREYSEGFPQSEQKLSSRELLLCRLAANSRELVFQRVSVQRLSGLRRVSSGI